MQAGERPMQMRERMIEQFDADDNGELSPEERANAFRERLELVPVFQERMLQRFDADENGALGEEEIEEALEMMQGRMGALRGAMGPGRGPAMGRMGRGPGRGMGGPGPFAPQAPEDQEEVEDDSEE